MNHVCPLLLFHILSARSMAKPLCPLGFPRDGTSRCPFVPGQKKILVPVSLCPGTRAGANVPGQTPLSRPGTKSLAQKNTKTGKGRSKTGKDVPKQEKDVPKQEKDVPKQEKVVLKQKRTFQNRKKCSETGNHWKKCHFFNVFSFVSAPRDVPGRDGTGCQNPVPSHGKILSLSRCPFVPGQGRNFCPVVPKSCAVPSRWKP